MEHSQPSQQGFPGEAFRQSTIGEIRAAHQLVDNTGKKITELVADGWYVEVFWDFDHVLMDGRSDDVFEMLGGNQDAMDSYYAYEERMLLSPPYDGLWAKVARRCGKLHQSQSVITARATFTMPRAHTFILLNGLPLRRLLAIGSQPKAESYRVTMQEAFATNPKTHIFMVDDGEHHVQSFRRVAEEMGVTDKTEAILSPRVRLYTPEDLQAHYAAVMEPERKEIFHIHEGRVPGMAGPRYTFQVAPGGRDDYRKMVEDMFANARREGIVNGCRTELEEIARRDNPDMPLTTERLYEIWRLVQNL